VALAEELRLPYWDWTAPSVPDILTVNRVTVLDVNGQPTQIRNPFFSYTFVVSSLQRCAGAQLGACLRMCAEPVLIVCCAEPVPDAAPRSPLLPTCYCQSTGRCR
jgi:hypothetical protein